MIEAIHTDAADRGEPLAGLIASEATIYGRFGYAIAIRPGRSRSTGAGALRRRGGRRAGIRCGCSRASDPSLPDEIGPRWDRSGAGGWARCRVGGEAPAPRRQPRWATTIRPARRRVRPLEDHARPERRRRRRTSCGSSTSCASTRRPRDALSATIMATDLVGPVVARLAPDDPAAYLLSTRGGRHRRGRRHALAQGDDVPAVFEARRCRTRRHRRDGGGWHPLDRRPRRTCPHPQRADLVVDPRCWARWCSAG